MTPSAMTAAGRAAKARAATAPRGAASAARGAATAPGHRRNVRPQPAPRGPRRVSGPSRGRYRSAAAPRPNATLPSRALAVVRGLPDHSLVDRIVRGRMWIPLLGVLLAGIIATQVEILKLNAGMGRRIDQASTLTNRNESLQASVATLADDQRIESLAAGMGMVMPAPTAISFLTVHPGGDVTHAIADIHQPDPTQFEAQLPAAEEASSQAAQTGTSSDATATTDVAAPTDSAPPGADGEASASQSPASDSSPTSPTPASETPGAQTPAVPAAQTSTSGGTALAVSAASQAGTSTGG